MTYPTLTVITFLPLVGAAGILFLGQGRRARWIALATTLATLAAMAPLCIGFDKTQSGLQFVDLVPWISIGNMQIDYHLGVDGISLPFIALSGLLTLLCVGASWTAIRTRDREFYAALLVAETAMIGLFAAANFFLFFIFWELMVVPLFLLIGVWGGSNRVYAAVKFLLFTLAGSVLMLVGMIALQVLNPNPGLNFEHLAGNTLKVWDAETGQETRTLKGHSGEVKSVSFSRDGKRIVSGGFDNTLKIWDTETGLEMRTLKGHSNLVTSVSFSRDGSRIVSGSFDKTLKVWDAESSQELLTLEGHSGVVTSVSFSPDGKRIVSGSGDKTLKVWDAETGQEMRTLKGHSGYVYSVRFSPDGKRIVSGGFDNTLKIWDAETGLEMRTLKGHSNLVTSVSFSPDGRRIVSGSFDKTLKVWDAESSQELLTLEGHSGYVYSVRFSPDGRRIVSGSVDKTLKVWDAETGQETLTIKRHLDDVYSVSFSPDGSRIVSCSRGTTLGTTTQTWLFLAFLAAFAIKVPMFPVHTWLPDAHTEAPTAGSVILAGILLKMGAYGFLRVALPVLPEAVQIFLMPMLVISVVAIIYGAYVTLAQTDIKRLIAYSSISHMGFVTLGIFTLNQSAVEGAILQMINHGIISAALFLCVGMIYERTHTREIKDYGGVGKTAPIYATLLALFCLAAAGFPGLNSFVGEFLIIGGAFKTKAWLGGLAIWGVVLGTTYLVWLYYRMIMGELNPGLEGLKIELTAREILTLAPLALLALYLGLYPECVLSYLHTPVSELPNIIKTP